MLDRRDALLVHLPAALPHWILAMRWAWFAQVHRQTAAGASERRRRGARDNPPGLHSRRFSILRSRRHDPKQLADSRRRLAARAIPYGEFSDRHLTMALMLFRNR